MRTGTLVIRGATTGSPDNNRPLNSSKSFTPHQRPGIARRHFIEQEVAWAIGSVRGRAVQCPDMVERHAAGAAHARHRAFDLASNGVGIDQTREAAIFAMMVPDFAGMLCPAFTSIGPLDRSVSSSSTPIARMSSLVCG